MDHESGRKVIGISFSSNMGSNLFPTPSIFFIFSQYFPKHGKQIFAPWGVPLRWVEHKVITKQVLSWFDGASIADIESRQDTHSQNLGDDPGKERRADGRIGSEHSERHDIAGFNSLASPSSLFKLMMEAR